MPMKLPRFLTGRGSQNGLAGYLQANFRSWGTATVLNGQTSIVVASTDIKAGDVVLATVLTKGANAAYVVGVTISAGTSYTISVNTDPGAGGAVLGVLVLRPTP